ncbi:hypothetical protein [Serratia sp. UGAL515B_01]|uniref:hypothetical protein n=1 Tax=Serratia sp. UGAL515B_01 TaxID=2986763 RepID=UPI002954F5C2|nr:hypothetical protein [Serratia sp. UGAL515B_01]WON77427.1 hypothetical protein OK023_01550 [Serratia sp. UGAL515B_01]
MLTLKLNNEHITLSKRDACLLAEGIVVALRNPQDAEKDVFRLGQLELSVGVASATPAANQFSTGHPILTNC